MTAIKNTGLPLALLAIMSKIKSSVDAMPFPNYDMMNYDSRSDSASWSDDYAIDDTILIQPELELIMGRSDNANLLISNSEKLLEQELKTNDGSVLTNKSNEPLDQSQHNISVGLLMLSIAALGMVLVIIVGIIGYQKLEKRDLKRHFSQSTSEASLQPTTTCSEIKIESIPDAEKSSENTLSFREMESEISEVKVPINWN